jgi:hypothetical protein
MRSHLIAVRLCEKARNISVYKLNCKFYQLLTEVLNCRNFGNANNRVYYPTLSFL